MDMAKGTYQLVLVFIVFCFGFSLNSIGSKGENKGDVYYQDKSELLRCTINLDCDNRHDWSMLFPKEEGPQDMYLVEVPDELKHHRYQRMY